MCIKIGPIDTKLKCECKDQKEYEIRLKCMKNTLHTRYISCIAIGIAVWLLATGEANNAEFSAWISFASTIASIILSVIAIIMSITGESKTDAMRERMEETAKKLDKAVDDIALANKDMKESISDLEKKIADMGAKVDKYTKQRSPKPRAKVDLKQKPNFENIEFRGDFN